MFNNTFWILQRAAAGGTGFGSLSTGQLNVNDLLRESQAGTHYGGTGVNWSYDWQKAGLEDEFNEFMAREQMVKQNAGTQSPGKGSSRLLNTTSESSLHGEALKTGDQVVTSFINQTKNTEVSHGGKIPEVIDGDRLPSLENEPLGLLSYDKPNGYAQLVVHQ